VQAAAASPRGGTRRNLSPAPPPSSHAEHGGEAEKIAHSLHFD